MGESIIMKSIDIQHDHLYSITYCLFRDYQLIDCLGEKETYGLHIQMHVDNNIQDIEEMRMPNIFSKLEEAMSVFQKILKCNVFPVHLKDVVLDYIS